MIFLYFTGIRFGGGRGVEKKISREVIPILAGKQISSRYFLGCSKMGIGNQVHMFTSFDTLLLSRKAHIFTHFLFYNFPTGWNGVERF